MKDYPRDDEFSTTCSDNFVDINAKISCSVTTKSNYNSELKINGSPIEKNSHHTKSMATYSGNMLLADLTKQPRNANFNSKFYILPNTEFEIESLVRTFRMLATEKGKLDVMVIFFLFLS